jgi:prevent-host-death family protein
MYVTGMAKRYSIAEARSNLASIVDQAEAGQEIELTRRGKPVAVVVSLRELERLRGERVPFRDAYRRFLERHPLREVWTGTFSSRFATGVRVERYLCDRALPPRHEHRLLSDLEGTERRSAQALGGART